MTKFQHSKLYSAIYFSIVAVVLISLTIILWGSYRRAHEEAESTTQNYVSLLDSHFNQVLSRVDAILETLAHEIPIELLNKAAVPANQAAMSEHMARLISVFPDAFGTFYFDANGDLLYSSNPDTKPFNISDREHYKKARDHAGNALIFSDAEVARSSGRWAVVAQRRISNAQGEFAGVTSLVIDLGQEERIMQSLHLAHDSVVSVWRTDTNKITMRFPFVEEAMNKVIPFSPSLQAA